MDIVQIVIYNLRLRREDELLAEGKEVDKDKMFFRFKEDICYFIDKNWGRVCFGKSRTFFFPFVLYTPVSPVVPAVNLA